MGEIYQNMDKSCPKERKPKFRSERGFWIDFSLYIKDIKEKVDF